MTRAEILSRLNGDGFVLLPAAFSPAEAKSIADEADLALRESPDAISSRGTVYAARNVAEAWPAVLSLWQRPALVDVLRLALGDEFGLVRVLYFDKPPGRSWSLPWHKDMTIAVARHLESPGRFGKPTVKAGVPHVEASEEVLNAMLTARLHLDDVTAENGPLEVLPGSHLAGKRLEPATCLPRAILAAAGDVLLMRPLVAHSSGNAASETARHRRIVHFEFAASPNLPDGYEWRQFIRPTCRTGF